MAYTHFQFITLEVPTGGPTDAKAAQALDDVHVLDSAANNNATLATNMDLDHLRKDAKYRLNWFLSRLEAARNSNKVAPADDGTTLKIFAAPEFFLRPRKLNPNNDDIDPVPDEEADKERFYNVDTLTHVKSILLAFLKQDDYQHWLIIPGTIIYDDNQYTENKLMAIQGGPQCKVVGEHNKIEVSDADGIPQNKEKKIFDIAKEIVQTATDIDEKKQKAAQADLVSKDLSKKRKALIKYIFKNARTNIFTHDGRLYGIDICLDHKRGVLRDTCIQYPNADGTPGVKVQLIVACGKSFNDPAVATFADGVVLRIDGSPGVTMSTVHTVEQNNFLDEYQVTECKDETIEIVRQFKPNPSNAKLETVRIFQRMPFDPPQTAKA